MTGERVIIRNLTDLPMATILEMASRVVAMGRVSGKDNDEYCYASRFKNGVICLAVKNKASDTLVFLEEE